MSQAFAPALNRGWRVLAMGAHAGAMMMPATLCAALLAFCPASLPPEPAASRERAYDQYCFETGRDEYEIGARFMLFNSRTGAFGRGRTGSAAMIDGSGHYLLHPDSPHVWGAVTGLLIDETLVFSPGRDGLGVARFTLGTGMITAECRILDPPASSAYLFDGWGRGHPDR